MMDIEELSGRVSEYMDKISDDIILIIECMQERIDSMGEQVEHLNKEITQRDECIKKLETKVEKIEKAEKLDKSESHLSTSAMESELCKRAMDRYWFIGESHDKYTAQPGIDMGTTDDDRRYYSHNYFRTKESANIVNKKCAMLRLFRWLHDQYCPGYVPDRKHEEYFYTLRRRVENGEWTPYCRVNSRFIAITDIFFTKEAAEKACEYLNKYYRFVEIKD